MIVTVFCDASFDNTGRAGYGVWAKCDIGTQQWSKKFKVELANSSEAEFAAAANAVYLAVREFRIKDTDVIVLQTDCLEVVTAIRKGILPLSIIKSKAITSILSYNVAIRARHVKGHRPSDNPRSFVNNLTDRAANIARKS